MNKGIENLLSHVYELEGLLLVMQRHSDDVPPVVVDRFKQKAQQVASEASCLEVNSAKPEKEGHIVPPACPQPPVFKGPEPVAVEQTSTPATEPVKPVAVAKEEPASPLKHQPRDIARAFSINDRFLFQRELFAGDATRLDETLSLMQKMRDMNQVQHFLTDDLQWDTSNDVVKEFIRLVGLSFKE